MVGGEYRLKEDHSATTAKKQILIHQTVFVLSEGCSGVLDDTIDSVYPFVMDMLCLGRKLSFL
jgi:hypothetical protein